MGLLRKRGLSKLAPFAASEPCQLSRSNLGQPRAASVTLVSISLHSSRAGQSHPRPRRQTAPDGASSTEGGRRKPVARSIVRKTEENHSTSLSNTALRIASERPLEHVPMRSTHLGRHRRSCAGDLDNEGTAFPRGQAVPRQSRWPGQARP